MRYVLGSLDEKVARRGTSIWMKGLYVSENATELGVERLQSYHRWFRSKGHLVMYICR